MMDIVALISDRFYNALCYDVQKYTLITLLCRKPLSQHFLLSMTMKKTPPTKANKNSRLVYSTETGRIKPNDTVAQQEDEGDGIVRLFRENRKGSGVTLIKGLPMLTDLKATAKILKKKLGVGGSIKDRVIEVQTDQREKIKGILEQQGHQVKIAGG